MPCHAMQLLHGANKFGSTQMKHVQYVKDIYCDNKRFNQVQLQLQKTVLLLSIRHSFLPCGP